MSVDDWDFLAAGYTGIEPHDTVEFGVDWVIWESELAWHLQLANGDYWIPKSIGELVITKRSILGNKGVVTVPEWFAIQEGLA